MRVHRLLRILVLIISIFLTHALQAADADWFANRLQQRKAMAAFRAGEVADRRDRAQKAVIAINALIDLAAKDRCPQQSADLQQLLDGMRRLDPELVAPLAERIKALPPPPATVKPDTIRTWQSTFRSKRTDLLLPTRRLIEKACTFMVPDVVHRGVRQYLAFWPDCEQLLTNMGKVKVGETWYGPRSAELARAGAVWDLKLGWVNAKTPERYAKGEYFDLQTKKWTTLDEANKRHADPTDPWIIQSEHLEVRGTAPLVSLVGAVNRLELFYDQIFGAYAGFFTGGKSASGNDLRLVLGMGKYDRLVVTVYKSREEFHHELPSLPAWYDGVFMPDRKGSFFYAIKGEIHIGIMYHEITHQILHLFTGMDHSPAWLLEGIAVYTEHPIWIDGELTVGQLAASPRLVGWARDHAKHEVMPPSQLMALVDYRDWATSKQVSEQYAAAGAMVNFCMEANDRSLRSDFVDFLRDSYCNLTKGHALWDYLGMTREQLLTAFETWAKQQHNVDYIKTIDPFDQSGSR